MTRLVENKIVGAIDAGLCLLVGLHHTDTLEEVKSMVGRVTKLKIFGEEKGSWKLSVKTAPHLKILAVSQFTLFARTDKGAKPDFHEAMKSEQALEFFNKFVEMLRLELGDPGRVETGAFGQMMEVNIVNDGPVTIILESKPKALVDNKKSTDSH